MKHLTLLSFFLIVLSVASVSAQSKMQLAKMKQRLMTNMKISDVKADSAVNIILDFYKNARSIKGSSDLKDDERKTALQNNRKTEMGRLRAAGFTTEEVQKLKQEMEAMKEERQHRKGAKDSTSS